MYHARRSRSSKSEIHVAIRDRLLEQKGRLKGDLTLANILAC